ncbi:MAG: SDR family NAD(P)-dependent oxidoreductase, partial [Rhodothermales bacterium]
MATLKNKVIVITGAAGRLGRHLVQRFAEEGAVIAAVVRDDEEARSIPFPENAEGWAFPVDVTDEELV